MSKKIKVYVAMLFAMVFWGISFIWSKNALSVYSPLAVLLFRLTISITLLLVLNIFLKRLQKVKKSDYLQFIALAFFQPFLYFLGENYGLLYVSSTVTSVIVSTIPLFTPVAAYFFLKEKISLINFIGIIISVGGVCLVILKDDLSISAEPIGLLLLVLAVFSAVVYTILVSKLSEKYNVYTIITYQNILGTLYFLPTFLIFDYKNFVSIGFNFDAFISIAALAVFGSTICYILFIYGVQHMGVTNANIFANIIPVFTAIFSVILLNEYLSPINIGGIAIVLLGLMITQINRKRLAKINIFSIKK